MITFLVWKLKGLISSIYLKEHLVIKIKPKQMVNSYTHLKRDPMSKSCQNYIYILVKTKT